MKLKKVVTVMWTELILRRVIQEERSMLWQALVSVIVSKNKFLMNVCPVLNGYGYTDIEIKIVSDLH
jgi:hypothetical protein